jgi:uncharacterized protein YggE
MHVFRLLTLGGLLACCFNAAADEPLRKVAVTGTGSVTTAPDRALISMSVQARNIDIEAARKRVVAVTARFLELAADLGIDDARVRTSGLTMRPDYRWDNQARQQELVGYFVQRQLDVELEDLELLGEVLEGAVDVGVNQVSPPVLDSSKRRELYRQALAAAAREARDNAAVLAQSLGARLGEVRELTALDSFRPPPEPMIARAMVAEAGAGGTYQTGEIRLEAIVNATFDLLVD